MALVFVSIAYSNHGARRLLAPGSLSAPHAQLLVADALAKNSGHTINTNDRCAACHPGSASPHDSSGASSNASAAASQSMLCLSCHKESMPDAVHGTPHDLHGKSLQMLVQKSQPSGKVLFASWRNENDWESNSTQCGQCHREHQGENHDLRSISSRKCQNCHQKQFASFSNGHPEFESYPKSGKPNIAFDHSRHQQLHFVKKNADFQCRTCHIQQESSGSVGQVSRSISFEIACASCHEEAIKSSLQDGFVVLQLPSVHRQELAKYGIDVSPWPVQASQMNDGIIPPLMRLLIQAEPNGTQLLSKLPTSGRISDIDVNDPNSRQSLRELTDLTRALIKRLADEGQPGFRVAMERILQDRILSVTDFTPIPKPSNPNGDSQELAPWLDRFSKGLPPDLFRAAYLEWFAAPADSVSGVASRRMVLPTAEVRLSSKIRDVDDDLLSGSDNLLDTTKKELPRDSNLLLAPSQKANALENRDSRTIKFVDSKSWQQLNFGGWMIDRQRMAIVYVPSGHADDWLSRWIEMEQLERTSPASSQMLSSQSQQENAVRQCRSCHGLHGDAGSEQTGNTTWIAAFRRANRTANTIPAVALSSDNQVWRSHRMAANIKPLTRFDHAPHLALPLTRDCTHCHTLVGNENGSAHSMVGREFRPIARSQCTSCHQPKGAGENCTQCHNYHVGEKSWWISH